MRIFLDTSVLLSASASAKGASREIFNRAPSNGWILIATPYAIREVIRHIGDFPASALSDWERLNSNLLIMDDVLTLDRPAVFAAGKDRPILFSAVAWADVLLTLDYNDFKDVMAHPFYGLFVLKPGSFLERERAEGRLK